VATGETHTVREFIDRAAQVAGFRIQWEGTGVDEVGRDAESGRVLVNIDRRFYRPAEVDSLLGDPTKAKEVLGWEAKVKFEELVEIMMKADLELLAS
jgi:GDPmannose 4,6-dehydratase